MWVQQMVVYAIADPPIAGRRFSHATRRRLMNGPARAIYCLPNSDAESRFFFPLADALSIIEPDGGRCHGEEENSQKAYQPPAPHEANLSHDKKCREKAR